MKILHVTCSPRGETSESYRLSKNIIGFLLKAHPAATVINRVVGGDALSAIDEPYAISQQASADVTETGSIARSDALIEELQQADVLVIGTPMHNFTVPSTLKLWIDHVARVRRTFNVGAQGKTSLLRDRPVYVAVSSGGRFSGVTPRQPDFLTPYLKAVLGMIGLHDVNFFSVEGTAMGPDAVAAARNKAGQALRDHFSANLSVEADDPSNQTLLTP
ncbi:FMN-dependent NADH-azoreductase [Pseudomonas migulae]|jgi:FMN-dependent NADH-azoreductase|uniref:FMN-dependent NADH-azoreductase n=1 Tax=Pseudomonas migulae TaxID=78543 RepID=UPI0020A02BC5|nr:NAD(P)H-dependent oxidoreductase [Pseudomonas migulae]MCP1495392.1 FMN-dependent NADH-azoreductase [Pseudomonas migulae]